MKYIIFVGIFLFTHVTSFAFDKETLARLQLNNQIPDDLRDKVPFLAQGFEQMNYSEIPEYNVFKISFIPDEKTFQSFARFTGTSIFRARFLVSWYVFEKQDEIPSSTDDVLALLNTTKPKYFSFLPQVNKQWEAIAELPYNALNDDSFVYAYISYPNIKGVLVPIASQSFYKDYISGLAKKQQTATLNISLLSYWKKQGYL